MLAPSFMKKILDTYPEFRANTGLRLFFFPLSHVSSPNIFLQFSFLFCIQLSFVQLSTTSALLLFHHDSEPSPCFCWPAEFVSAPQTPRCLEEIRSQDAKLFSQSSTAQQNNTRHSLQMRSGLGKVLL